MRREGGFRRFAFEGFAEVEGDGEGNMGREGGQMPTRLFDVEEGRRVVGCCRKGVWVHS
jgi:hypothetical protein